LLRSTSTNKYISKMRHVSSEKRRVLLVLKQQSHAHLHTVPKYKLPEN